MGGFVLLGVGATAACMQIAPSVDRRKKNEIFVETVGSTLTSVGAGIAVGAFLVSNPIGWGTALVLAAGSAVGALAGGKLGVGIYTRFFNRVDVVGNLGVDKVCR